MYRLELADGTVINDLDRLNPSTFQFRSNDPNYYWILSPSNLAFATLYKDDELEEVFIDYIRNSYYASNGVIEFRITPSEAQIKEKQNQADQIRKERTTKNFMKMAEKEMNEKGW